MNWTSLTWAQQIVWTGQAIAPDSPLYNQAYCCDLTGPLDQAAMLSAFEALSQDVDALSLVFKEQDGVPVQAAVGTPARVQHITAQDRDAAQVWMETAALQVFALTECASTYALITLTADHHVVFFCHHHLIIDGRSGGLMLQALAARYNAPSTGPTPPFLAVTSALETARPTDAFDASLSQSPISLYGKDQQIGGTEMVSLPLDLGESRNQALRSLASSAAFRSLTPLMSIHNILATLTTAWLNRVSGQTEAVFAMPQHNRVAPQYRDTIGMFMEMLPLHVVTSPDDSFTTLSARVSEAIRAMMIAGGPGTTRVDLLRRRNVVLNIFSGAKAQFNGLEAHARIIPVGCSDPAHDVNIEFADLGDTGQFTARMMFDASRFDALERARAGAHFLALFDAFMDDPDAHIAGIHMIGIDEEQALAAFNAGSTVPQPQGTVVDAFLENLSDSPAVRLSGSDARLTHNALDIASNRMANLLIDQGAQAGDRIAVHLRRSVETVISILAIHKLGAAFVPLEVNLPKQRLDFILKDTDARLVISEALEGGIRPKDALSASPAPVSNQATPDTPAYVIYTSGSTGQPKGVVIVHSELLAYCQMCLESYPLEDGKSFAFFSAFGFDLTINSLFMPLISGGEIVIYPEPDVGGDLAIIDVFEADEVDIVKPTPSHLRMAIAAAPKPVSRIKLLPHSGEAFPSDLARQALDVLGPDLTIINEYGPTEAVVGTMLHRFAPVEDQQALVPLGHPAPGMRVYVLNGALAHQPIGMAGEIAIGGRLAQGYLNRPDLTAAQFVPDPHQPNERIYLTGDLGVFAAPGDLRYLGRMDDQVKMNGVRIELGEVEHAIAQVDGITSAVAAVQQDLSERPCLVAYVQGSAKNAAIVDAVQRHLPNAVSLAAVVRMDAFPLSANGKIDRQALPAPTAEQWLAQSESRAPETDMEIALAAVFSECLGVASIGAEDDFYALGGDSLAAVRITQSALTKGMAFSAVDIFRCRTIAALAQMQKETAPQHAPPKPRRRFSRLSADAQAQLGQALGPRG